MLTLLLVVSQRPLLRPLLHQLLVLLRLSLRFETAVIRRAVGVEE
jgi:hypothetical protein